MLYDDVVPSGPVISAVGEAVPSSAESLETLIFQGAAAALEAAGLERDDLDGVVIAASDQVDGRAISSMLTSGPAGAYLNEEVNVASSPAHALILAWMQVLSGTHRRLLVSTWGKASESGGSQPAERLSVEPFFERDAGLSAIAAAAMQARCHRQAGGARAEAACAWVASKNHGADSRGDALVSPDDVSSSALVAFPLRALECPAEVDGSFSLVLERADRGVERAVLLESAGWCSDSGRLAERDLTGVPHLRRAAGEAYSRAGVSDPATEIDVFELHDYTPDAELIAYPAVGLCGVGEAPGLALDGVTGRGGRSPVNPAGGSMRGEAPFGGAMRKVLSAVRQLRGEAGVAQCAGASQALVQISSGFAGQFASAFVLRAAP